MFFQALSNENDGNEVALNSFFFVTYLNPNIGK